MSIHTPKAISRSFHVTAKPVGALCNLDCTYCYYSHTDALLSHTASDRMSDELLEEFIRQYVAGQDVDSVVFCWHGGEPALMGLDFFRKVTNLQQKYAGTKRIENSFQTNGVLLDAAWCRFFKEHGFLLGLSIDGPRELHDRFRRTRNGEPTFDQVLRAARLLQEHEVSFNALTVIHSDNARHPDEVYGFLTEELGCRHLQWLPCVQRKDSRSVAYGHWDAATMPVIGSLAAKPGHSTSVVADYSVDPDVWGEFLCRTFDLWLKNGLGKVLVNWFESLVAQWMGKQATLCSLAGVCGRSLVTLERDGSLYCCDHFVYPEYRLGHLLETNSQLGDIVYSDRQRHFGCAKHKGLPDCCKQCGYHFACNGECPKNRFLRTPNGQPGLNYLCSGIKRFLAYADPYLRQIAAEVQRDIG